ncbi:NUDIX hydrolase [Ktedonobacter racemifer]|uniref:NUDIX hydrolase n=1 Tax=Ktedonobacter racemifer DSM 44963 TaxID=485913 RepID=D6TQ58_KTERA|nr:NUDIX domain-containing protein [Ktedonobacter racemifer]EFH85706.1 NUDIX hydrolase [Ktedonobacter racemifer DSM 44963]
MKEEKKGSLIFLLIEHSFLTTLVDEIQQVLFTTPNVICLPSKTELLANLLTSEQDAFQICDAHMGSRWRKDYPDSVVLLACSTSADEILSDSVDYVLEPQIFIEQLRGIMFAEQSRRALINRRLQVAIKRHCFDYTATGYVLNEARTQMLLIPKGNQWFPPGGHVEDGEFPDEALRREVQEETGYTVNFLGQQACVGMQIGDAQVHPQPYLILCEDLQTHSHYDFLYLIAAHTQVGASEFEGQWMDFARIEDLDTPEHVKWVAKQLRASYRMLSQISAP